jgi:hypothetical protein
MNLKRLMTGKFTNFSANNSMHAGKDEENLELVSFYLQYLRLSSSTNFSSRFLLTKFKSLSAELEHGNPHSCFECTCREKVAAAVTK